MSVQDYAMMIIEDAMSGVRDWETDMSPFFSQWNEWGQMYRMNSIIKEPRPGGVSKNMTAETPRAVNALATSITRMQTAQDPFFELRSDMASEEKLFQLQKVYEKQLMNTEFKRKLLKGNRSMCLFGTQVWEEPYMTFPPMSQNPDYEGTDFNPLSLLQSAFRSGVFDIRQSDFFAPIHRFAADYLRFITNTPIWNRQAIEEGLAKKDVSDGSGFAQSSIDRRRQDAGYIVRQDGHHEMILWTGRLKDYNNPLIAEMWQKYGRKDDPKYSDITVGILNRKHLIRLNPAPYGTWHHTYKIGHYTEFELEPIAYAVGAFAGTLQKDMNRIMRRVNDVELLSLYNMMFAGAGSGLNQTNLNVFPFSVIKAGDVNQIKEFRPQIEGILHGLTLLKETREDFRSVTHATNTLQAVISGATATESSLAQSEALRAVSMIAEINAETVIKPHLVTMHKNYTDQNPYSLLHIPDADFIPKTVTDKDYRPEHSKQLLEFATLVSSIRQNMPLDFNPMPIYKQLARAIGINPSELREPRPQIDKMLDAMQRINANSQLKQMVGSEVASEQTGGGKFNVGR